MGVKRVRCTLYNNREVGMATCMHGIHREIDAIEQFKQRVKRNISEHALFLPFSVESVDNIMYSNLLLNRRLLLEFLFTIHTSVSTIIFLSLLTTFNIEWQV